MALKVGGGSAAQRIASTQTAKETAKPKATAGGGSAQKAWAPSGAKKQQATVGLKVTKGVIDEGVKTQDKFVLPKGYSAVPGSLKHSESMPLADGRTAKLDVDWATLSIKGPNGKSVELNPLADALKEQKEWFREEFKGAKKEDLEFVQPEWYAERSMSSVGGAGHMVSVYDAGSSYTGGAHPNHGGAVNTFDVRTGKKVMLDELVPKDQVDKLAVSIHARLQTMKGPDEVDGVSFTGGGDVKSIRDTINENFALVADKKGKLNIEISWESGIHALGPLSAHFTVPAPTDDAFKARIGAE